MPTSVRGINHRLERVSQTQAPKLNRNSWNQLEGYIRKLIAEGSEAYVVAGTYGAGGTSDNGTASTIAGGKVTVSAAMWKVIVVLPVK